MDNIIGIVFILAIMGPSIRIIDKQGRLRFSFDGLIIEVIDKIMMIWERGVDDEE